MINDKDNNDHISEPGKMSNIQCLHCKIPMDDKDQCQFKDCPHKSTEPGKMSAEEIAKTIFYSPATNGRAERSIAEGVKMIEAYANLRAAEVLRDFAMKLHNSDPEFQYSDLLGQSEQYIKNDLK